MDLYLRASLILPSRQHFHDVFFKLLKRFCFDFFFFFFNLFILMTILACQTVVHKKCHDKLLGTCSESSFNSESTIVSIKYNT